MNKRTPFVLLSNILGNTMEWYDFALYGSLAPVIARLFFPSENSLSSLVLTFGVFASGFLMRPLGGIIFGHIGDRYGRKKALLLSILLMTIPTVLFGLIPTSATLGVFAPISLTFLRLAQGVAVGGEFTGTMSYLVEMAPPNKRGFAGSFALVGVLGGILLGSGTVAFISYYTTQEEFSTWGWRVAYLFGGVLGCCVLLMRQKISESSVYELCRKKNQLVSTPLEECIRHYKIPILKGFGMTFLNSLAFYIIIVYTTTYFNQILKMSLTQSVSINFFLVGLTMIFVPITGALSDRLGRKTILGLSAFGFLFLAYPMNLFFLSNPPLTYFLLGQALIAVLLALYLGPLSTALAEMMPNQVRYTAISLAYNTSLALFGGTAPLLVTYFIEQTQLLTIPGILLTCAAVVSLAVIFSMRETAKLPLNGK